MLIRNRAKGQKARIAYLEERLGTVSSPLSSSSGSFPGVDSNAFHNGGDSFGANARIGTNDTFDLEVERGGTLVADFSASRLKLATSYYLGIGTDTRSFSTDLLVLKHTTSSVTSGMSTDLTTGFSAYTCKSNDTNHMQFGIVNNAYVSPSTPITAGAGIVGLSNAVLPGTAKPIWIYNDLNEDIVIATNQVRRATFYRSGGLGINQPIPRRLLDVLDASNPQLRLTHTDNTDYLDVQVDTDGNTTFTPSGSYLQILKSGGATVGGLTEGQLHFKTVTNTDDLTNAVTFGAHSSTAAANHNRAQAGIYVKGGNSYGTKMYFGTSSSFAAGATTKLSIIHSGEVGIGIGETDPTAMLQVKQGTIGNAVLKLESTATNDDPADTYYHGRVAVTDATPTTLHTVAIPASTTAFLEAKVRARRTGGAAGTAEDGAAYVVRAAYKNVAGTATLIGAINSDFTAEDQAAWDCTFTTSGGNVLLQFTGAANNNVTVHSTLLASMVST